MKKVICLLLALLMVIAMVACAAEERAPEQESDPVVSTDASAESATSEDPYRVAVLVKATTSEVWQLFLSGARKAAAESDGRLVVDEYGTTTETDIEGQISILEDIIASEPDAIYIAPLDAKAIVPAVEEAMGKGIKVVVYEIEIETEQYTTWMYLNSYHGGQRLAEQMVKDMQEAGMELKGTVGIVSAVPVQTVYDRDDGFIDKLAELAPEIKVISGNYVENDMQKSMALTLDYINAYPDLIGVYGDNNVTGSGVALAIAEAGMQDKLVAVGYDANPEEVAGLADSSMDALMTTDLFQNGYEGTMLAFQAAAGEIEAEKQVQLNEILITPENLMDEDIQRVVNPS